MNISMPDHADAFVQRLDRHRALLVKIARVFGRTPPDREDIAAEIVQALWIAFPRYDDRFNFSTWMYRIALNVAISYDRVERRRAAGRSDVDLSNLDIAIANDPLDERVSGLFAFIATLRPIDRAIIVLHLDAYSYGEIAAMLGLTLTNVATKLNRIKRQASVALPRANAEGTTP